VRSIHRNWNILFQPLQTASRLHIFLSLLALTHQAHAIVDFNQNGVSDLWEKKYNQGNLYSTFNPTADPDGDGWTNAQEAVAGTDPADGRPAIGFLQAELTHIPAVYLSPTTPGAVPTLQSPQAVSIRWKLIFGKKYTVFASPDLTPGSWVYIGEPQIINPYSTPGLNIALTQPDGSIPPKLFFRLSVEDKDTDGDTLTDYDEIRLRSSPNSTDTDQDGIGDRDELLLHHTDLIAADSDHDGVTDGDEILVNFTNPLTATDADRDGIPDDFEKHFAKQLLAYKPDPTTWGVQHAGLLTGNLDATHDYTGDGMSAQQLAETLNNIPTVSSSASGYVVEQQARWNSLQSAYYYPSSSGNSSEGTYSHSVPNDFDVLERMTPTADLSSQYLLSRINEVAWGNSYLTSGDRMDFFFNGMVESAFRRTPTPAVSSNGIQFQGRTSQQRCRLIATNPGHEAYSRTYIKVIKNSNYFNWDHRGVITAEPFTVQFPKGKMLSDWFEFKAPIVDESEGRSAELALRSMDLKAFKRGTLNVPGAEVPAETGEFGCETVMMENADSESAAASISRDCDESGAVADLNAYRKTNDDDLVKIVLKWPPEIKPAGASLKLLHVGMQIDATQTTADAAVSTNGPSRLNFYKADGTRITNPTTDLQIADLANAPASSYLSKILTDGEVTIFIEGADRFGDLPNDPTLLGGAQLKWEFTQGATTATVKLLVYRGGFLRFMQPAGAPGTVGDFEFWDGKGRVKNKVGKPIFGKEFETDVTDYGTKLVTWKAKSGKTTDNPVEKIRGKAYNIEGGFGHTPPGWWKTKRRTGFTGTQPDQISGTGPNKKIKQGGYVRWKQDDEADAANRYTTVYRYDASNTHDAAIGEPTSIRFKYDMSPITPSEAQNRTDIQIHPDGECTDTVMAGTAGCIGIQSYSYCEQVLKTIENYHGLKVKVQLSQP
jgi:hypothetical protein